MEEIPPSACNDHKEMKNYKNSLMAGWTMFDYIYTIKCIIGVSICYMIYRWLPEYPFYWAIVSVVLALSEDDSNEQAYFRIKANLLGCTVGACIYPLRIPELTTLLLGVVITIIAGFVLNITETTRTALAALIIVVIEVEQSKHWEVAIERVVCVVTGCTIALLITLSFNLIYKKPNKK
jgi:uncharacterized membrane protein YgaE (UPF0421/DUF939 family)